MNRPTIIDFVEHYTAKYAGHVFLREKVNEEWTATTYSQTREQAHLIGAGLMALGLKKGERVALLSQGRNLWVTGELGILYAGAVNVPLSIKLEEPVVPYSALGRCDDHDFGAAVAKDSQDIAAMSECAPSDCV